MKKYSEETQLKILPWLVAVSFFMQMLDSSILNTALPAIADNFGENPLQMQAVVVAYLLSAAVFLPISGWLADRFGAKKIFLAAIILFTFGSLLCAISNSLITLSASRVIQGMGGALLVPVGRLAVLRVYPRKEFVKVLSFIVLPALIGPLIGPALGGFLVQYASWHWIFLINIPIGILCFSAAVFCMPKIKTFDTAKFDWPGFIIFDGAILFLFVFASKTSFCKIAKTHVFLISVILILIYCIYSAKKKNALFNFQMFKNRSFAIGTAGNFFSRLAGGAMPFLTPLFLQTALGFSPAKAGATLLPMGIAAIFAKSIVSSAIKKSGYRKFLIVNTVCLSAFVASMSLIDHNVNYIIMLILLAFFGMANSFQFTAVTTLSLIDLPDSMISGGNTLSSVVMQVSMAAGVALAAYILAAVGHFQETHSFHAGNLLFTFHSTYIIISIVSLLSVFVFIFVPKDAGSKIKDIDKIQQRQTAIGNE
ncbi:MAG: multidrug transporter subunit MdtD [Endomicrobia bacterium]|nr:multidrug transporter subunit MdtD [Endomicrobiia bacterium]